MRLHAYGLSLGMLTAVLSPLLLDPQDPSQDSYPPSTYPMFSYDRDRTFDIIVAVARGPAGFEAPVPPVLVASAETMHAQKALMKAVYRGRAKPMCREIAERVARAGAAASLGAAREIAIVERTVDVLDYLAGDELPSRTKVVARCPIRGRK
jgi:hypothetical protein